MSFRLPRTALALNDCPDELARWLIDRGADIEIGDTPLHSVSNTCNLDVTRALIAAGAKVNALNEDGLTPLAYALQRCSNSTIERMVPFAQLLLASGAKKTAKMKKFVAKLGKNFEFYRSGFNPDSVEATSDAMDKLYALFDVEPAPRRVVYDQSPIIVTAESWVGHHQELWSFWFHPVVRLIPFKVKSSVFQEK